MIVSYANVDSLYKDVLATIAHLMRANKISVIDMRDTVFGKNGGWEELFINNKGEIGYSYRLIIDGDEYTCREQITFPYDVKDWNNYIHRLDLPNLLKVVVNKICDNIMVCDNYILRLDLPNLLKVVVNKICDNIMVCDINDYNRKKKELLEK